MEVAAGAMSPLLRKLGDLLLDEYNLENRVRKGVKSLLTELELMYVVLRKVGDVPPDQLDEQVLIWAGKVRELSYDMEDAVDAFMVRVEEDGHDGSPTNMKNRVKKFLKKTTKLFSKGKALHQISDAIQEAQDLAKELGELRQRYTLDAHANTVVDAIDPRLKAVYKDVTELVGIEATRDKLIEMLTEGHDSPKQQLKTISIVGFGGLGKTTLAKAVYDKIKVQFDCGAFVSVSQNPDTKKIFKKMLYVLDKNKFSNINEAVRDDEQLINELRMFLQDKRYLIVIDDIWDEEAWGFIKCAFSNNSRGSRVMTTTRIGSVSKACCSSSDDIIYKMTPLTEDNSKRLFYKRIFPQGSECPHELEEVSGDILKKCGGVPLAIITIASLLAGNDQQIKPKYQWDNLLNSIGRGLAEGGSTKDMQRILSFSYYNLPSHLKTCLLYLSIFPEDYVIKRDRLIWRWIAEGFVQGEKQETRSLYELGESYFNELINRNMIQPVIYVHDEGRANACRVHDMMLDLICSLSSKENFVTILDGTEGSTLNSQSRVRRLSFQNSMSELTTLLQVDNTNMSQVRSVTLFRTDAGLIQSLSYFKVLRVLDLEGCDLGEGSHKMNLKYVENLLCLRYLGLKDTHAGELPMEIGKLRFLQTLDLRGSGSKLPKRDLGSGSALQTLDLRGSGSKLPKRDLGSGSALEVPSSLARLRHLMCLYADEVMKMPVGTGNMASLEVLTKLFVGGSHAIEKELGQLIELRVLDLYWYRNDESMCNSLVVSLGNLKKLQSLRIFNRGNIESRFDVSWDGWVPPPHLRILEFHLWTSTLPRWINSSSLPLLSCLRVEVDEVRGEDIQILGMLPALRSLWLATTKHQYACVEITVGADAFPCVRECRFLKFSTAPCMFPRGAMPRLEWFQFYALAWDIGSGKLDVGMGHLPSLQSVDVTLWSYGVNFLNSDEAEPKLRLAVDAHPKRPYFVLSYHYL